MVARAAARDLDPARPGRVRSQERERARETAWPAARAQEQETGLRQAAALLDFSAGLLPAKRAAPPARRAASPRKRFRSTKPKCTACCGFSRNSARPRKARAKRRISTRPHGS